MNHRVTRELSTQMQQMYEDGYSLRAIAKILGVGKSTVGNHVTLNKPRKKLDASCEHLKQLPTKPEDIVLCDVESDNAKYMVTLESRLLTKRWFTNTYPNWRHMYEHCLYYGLTDIIDFKDIDNCMKPNTRQVRGVAINAHGKKSAKFTIDFLKDEPVEFSDLFL